MNIDQDLILAVVSIVGAWSAASTFLWFISAYKNVEASREKRRSRKPLGLVLRVKLLMTIFGAVSIIILYFENREMYNYVAWIAITIFVFWLVINRKPPF
jgi:O-antigen/teichoic acid export membrane protein